MPANNCVEGDSLAGRLDKPGVEIIRRGLENLRFVDIVDLPRQRNKGFVFAIIVRKRPHIALDRSPHRLKGEQPGAAVKIEHQTLPADAGNFKESISDSIERCAGGACCPFYPLCSRILFTRG